MARKSLTHVNFCELFSRELFGTFIGSIYICMVSQGPVVINSGSTIVKASEGVTITKDFEVKNGAGLMISIE